MKKILLSIFLTFLFGHSHAQAPTDHIERFFKMQEELGFDQAIDTLFITNKWFAESKGAQENIKSQLSTLRNRLGDYYGYESLTAQRVGTCYEYYTYLMKYERQPIRVHFSYYKAKDKWILQNFKYEDKIANDLEESALISPITNIELEEE